MHRLITSVALATLLALSFTAAQAADCTPSNASDCTATCGGTFDSCTRSGSSVSCVCPSTTKDVKGNAFGTATQDTSTGQGNLTDQPPPTDLTGSCTGNKGQCKQQ